MLNVGDRYILFLRRTAGTGDLRLGYVYGEAGGFQGKIGELDEYPTVNNWQAKVLLRNGVTQAPQLLGTPDDHWRFRSGPQILDVPEAVAIQTIRQQLAQKSP